MGPTKRSTRPRRPAGTAPRLTPARSPPIGSASPSLRRPFLASSSRARFIPETPSRLARLPLERLVLPGARERKAQQRPAVSHPDQLRIQADPALQKDIAEQSSISIAIGTARLGLQQNLLMPDHAACKPCRLEGERFGGPPSPPDLGGIDPDQADFFQVTMKVDQNRIAIRNADNESMLRFRWLRRGAGHRCRGKADQERQGEALTLTSHGIERCPEGCSGNESNRSSRRRGWRRRW